MDKQALTSQLFHSDFFQEFKPKIESGGAFAFEAIPESAKALLIAFLHHVLQVPVLILSQGSRQSQWAEDLHFFSTPLLEFPSWEALPEEGIPPSHDIIGRRMEVLQELKSSKHVRVVQAPLQAVLQKVPSQDSLEKLHVSQGASMAYEELIARLKKMGYQPVQLVQDKGSYALRGGIIDIFPFNGLSAYRLEFFGDEITLIKRFDPMSQHSIDKVSHFDLYGKEEAGGQKSCSLIDYFPSAPVIIYDDPVAIEDTYAALKKLTESMGSSLERMENFLLRTKNFKTFFFLAQAVQDIGGKSVEKPVGRKYYQSVQAAQKVELPLFHHQFEALQLHLPCESIGSFLEISAATLHAQQMQIVEQLGHYRDFKVIFCASSLREIEALKPFFSQEAFQHPILCLDYLSSSMVWPQLKLILFSHAEFFHRLKLTRKKWRNTYHTPLSDFHELTPGDYVVHLHSGIGRYLGIEKQKNHLGQEDEYLHIAFASDSKLYVPIAQSHLVSRYIGVKEAVPELHTLGGQKWSKLKAQAHQSIVGYAKDLLEMQAKRQLAKGFVYGQDSAMMAAFEAEFPYHETEDQLKAIADIKSDMVGPNVMDRLLCGDVGYGKTEVAMRAAFKAVADGQKQVAVLVPTTILAIQHYETFLNRMAGFPVRIGVICRFKTSKEIKETLEKLIDGKIDILIGTQRLLSQDVVFNDLGLLIIDEEQRFGVRAKEKLKKLKVSVDCLTMSATPIPRTLYFSLLAAKDLSVINSPPHDRLPIKTIICDRDDQMIQQALLRELSRDGQAYYIHNRVETLYEEASKIQKLLPQAKVAIVHGQLDSDLIDDAFHAFKQGHADILVATSIVENGIDIPNANTIIIDRCEQFGISDLYQLRGRVGRYNKPSYAYFMTPRFARLQETTQKRLRALVESSGYGGGMKLAMLDLEIRGAGDLLGVKQSGHVASIGFHLYCKLLKKTMDALEKKKPAPFIDPKLEFPFAAKIPEDYLPDISLRLELYHRLGDASDEGEVAKIRLEIIDRFGRPPQALEWLFAITRIRIKAAERGMTLIKIEKLTLIIEKTQGNQVARQQVFIKEPKTPSELEALLKPYL